MILRPGGHARPIISAKALESRGLAYFARHLLGKYEAALDGKGGHIAQAANLLRFAGEDLKQFFHIINVHGRRLEQDVVDEATACAINHNARLLNLCVPNENRGDVQFMREWLLVACP